MDFDTLKNWVRTSWNAQADAREQMEDDFNFADGHQWTDEEISSLKMSSRVPIVFNRSMVIISSVVGSEINNRTEVRFIPREIGDVKPNEVLSAGAEWFRDQANAEDEDSAAFRDTLICGLGWTETTLDFEEDPEGEPKVVKIDPLEMGYDHFAYSKGLADARYFFRVKSMPAEEAKYEFPGFDDEEIDATWINSAGESDKHTNVAGDEYDDGEDVEGPRNEVRVVQIQYKERVRAVEYVDPQTGRRKETTKEQWDKLTARFPIPMQFREFTKSEWKQAILGSNGVLVENQPDPEETTFNAITGHWDRKDKRFYGILKSMRDPQKYANKWLSQSLHIFNSNAKGGVMVETDAAVKPKDFEDNWAASDSVTWFKPGALSSGKVQEKPKGEIPAGLMQLTEYAVSSIRDASGVNLELLGLRDANQPGVLEYQRRQSAMTTLAGFFDSLRYYRKRQGVTILNFLRNHIAPTGRLVRIMKEDRVQYIPLALDDETMKYDVIVDDAPQAPNEKEKAWSVISEMMPMLMNADMSMEDWADVLEYSPLPSSFSEKLREKAQEQKNKGPTPQEQLMQAELQAKMMEPQVKQMELQAKSQEIQTKSALEAKKLQIEEQKVALEASRPPEDRSLDVARLELDRQKLEVEKDERTARVMLDARRLDLDAQRAVQENEHRTEDRRSKNNDALTKAGLPPDYSFNDDREQFKAIMEKVQSSDEAIAKMIELVADGQVKLGEGQKDIAEGLKELAQAEKASKRVVRDAEGKVVGVETAN